MHAATRTIAVRIETNMNIGKIILVLREHANLTQIEFCKISGISQGFLSKIESGKAKDPGIIACVKILSALSKIYGEVK